MTRAIINEWLCDTLPLCMGILRPSIRSLSLRNCGLIIDCNQSKETPMTNTQFKYDVVAIGNAIVDVQANVEDSFLEEKGLRKGTMEGNQIELTI